MTEEEKLLETKMSLDNIAYNVVQNWISRQRVWREGVLWYQIEPVLLDRTRFNSYWHCFYIRADIYRRYLKPYFNIYNCDCWQKGPYLVVSKEWMDCALKPLEKGELEKLKRKFKEQRIFNAAVSFQDEVKWEFYNTFLTYLHRIYRDFDRESPDIMIAGPFLEQSIYKADPGKSYALDGEDICCL
ncbi:MAG: hypothetical protein ACI4A3_10350 [Lachnospiraceae bacterium]